MKENVIVGRLVPAGTGFSKGKLDIQSRKQDQIRLAELEKQALENKQQDNQP